MKRFSVLLCALCVTLVVLSQLSSPPKMQVVVMPDGTLIKPVVAAPTVSLSTVAADATNLGNLIAVDWQETSQSLVVSVHATKGQPNNLVRVSSTGNVTQFSTANGFPEEVYLAVAPSTDCSGKGLSMGGFTVGDVFVGSGFNQTSGFATIARVSADGSTVVNPWATLPGETGLGWGGLYFDRTGNFGGDLLVSTTTGGIYRVNNAGNATLLARLQGNGAVEGIISLPNDSSKFGPLAGKILVGGTDIGQPSTGATNVLAVDPIDGTHPMGTFTAFSLASFGVVEPEGFRIVPQGGDFFGTDFMTQSVVKGAASQFSTIVGDLVIASEGLINPNSKTSHLYDVVWDPSINNLRATLLPGGDVFQYEGITFSCLSTPTATCTLNCPANICVTGTGPTIVNFVAPTDVGGSGVTASCSPPSGSPFLPGTTPVMCTVLADTACSNLPLTCTFNVTVAGGGITLVDIGGSGSTLTFDPTTGAFTFICGGGGLTVTGTGTVTARGGMITLQDNTTGGHCVNARVDLASCKGSATLEVPMGFVQCQITGRVFAGCSACGGV